MPSTKMPVQYQVLKLGNERYAILPESTLKRLMKQAGVQSPHCEPATLQREWEPEAWNAQDISEHLITRRERTGLSQVDLARRAGVRVETLNRIERGKTNPDFSTIRKLVTAIR